MATQTTSSLRSLSVEIQVVDTRDGKLSTVFQIDTFRILDDVYLNSKLTTYVLSNNTIQRILMYISFFTSIHQFGQKTPSTSTINFLDYSKIRGRTVTVKLKY